MNETGWLIVGCIGYAAVIIATFYVFLALPLRRRASIEVFQIRRRPELAGEAGGEVEQVLARAETELRSRVSLTHGKVAAGLRLVRYASRRLLEQHDSPSLREFVWQLRGSSATVGVEPLAVMITKLRRADVVEVERLEDEFGLQRRTTWLSLVGLLLVGAIALLIHGRASNIALGALGGFAAAVRPFILGRPADRDYGTSWNVLILSPVAGALAAVPGLLLVALLASDGLGLLGPQFTHVWDRPRTATALGISVVVGLVGGLLGSLAQSASGMLTGPTNQRVEDPVRSEARDGEWESHPQQQRTEGGQPPA